MSEEKKKRGRPRLTEEEKAKKREQPKRNMPGPGRPPSKKLKKAVGSVGTPKGVALNVENRGLENSLRMFSIGHFDEAVQCWRDIDDNAAKFNAYLKLLEFVFPKKRAVEVKADIEVNSLERRLRQKVIDITNAELLSDDDDDDNAINLQQ